MIKKTIFSPFFYLPCLFFAFLVFGCYHQRKMQNQAQYEGVIIDKHIDHNRRGIMQITVQAHRYTQYFDLYNYNYYDKIDSGDYIIKRRGESEYRLVENGDTSVFYNDNQH